MHWTQAIKKRCVKLYSHSNFISLLSHTHSFVLCFSLFFSLTNLFCFVFHSLSFPHKHSFVLCLSLLLSHKTLLFCVSLSFSLTQTLFCFVFLFLSIPLIYSSVYIKLFCCKDENGEMGNFFPNTDLTFGDMREKVLREWKNHVHLD